MNFYSRGFRKLS